MAEPLHILVLGSTPEAARWRASGHTVTELRGGRLRAALATWRGIGREADVVVEAGRDYLSALWGWIDAPRLHVENGPPGRLAAAYRPLLYGDGRLEEAPTEEQLREAAGRERVRVRDAVSRSETAKAAGLAAATLGANAIQLVFTIVFTRVLGVTDYGSLAVLISAFLILLVAGAAIQAAAARDTALGTLGGGEQLAATLAEWGRRLLAVFAAVTVASVLLRQPIADVVGAPEHPWGAAAILPCGVAWWMLCLQRGVLQGLHAYAPVARSLVGEAAGRLVFALALVAAGTGVTGAFLGQLLTIVATGIWLAVVLRRRLGSPATHSPHRLGRLLGDNWRPMTSLLCLGALQNVDVIVVKHQLGSSSAGSYAAAAVAAKTFVWIAIGVGLHLLPEATRRAAAGLDPRQVLVRALQLAALVTLPALVLFATVPALVLRLAFGEEYTDASTVLIVLGLAMLMLAVTYLTTQYLIALGRRGFLGVLVGVAVIEPIVLFAGDFALLTFALIVLAVQAVAMAGVLAIGLRGGARTA